VRRGLIRLLTFGMPPMAIMAMFLAGSCSSMPASGTVLDEAKAAGVGPEKLRAADEDYFADMDGGVTKAMTDPAQAAARAAIARGRNTWIVWTGGNDRFWDTISTSSFGALDLLKTVSSYKNQQYTRASRWKYLGLANEPCFTQATGPDPKHHGLWLDQRIAGAGCPPDPFADEQKYPGVKIGARGKNMPVGSYYGEPTGIVGLRLFPNPAFDEAAARAWDANPDRYYSDPSFYLSKDLVRPYRVGMSCGFCHIGPNPVNPPANPEAPTWANLSSNVGAQYFWVDRIFDWDASDWDLGQPGKSTSFFFQLFHSAKPGSLDTSLVSTDNISNPRTMNAVYALMPRLEIAKEWHREILAASSPGSNDNKQFNDYVPPLPDAFKAFYDKSQRAVLSPRVLKDGADSVGALGALNRVYLNIGLFSEEWLLHFRPLFGGQETTPIRIATARKNSSYWSATEAQTPDMAVFFLNTTAPHQLKDAPGGSAYLTADNATLARGKDVFAERCARCHSSKHPPLPPGLNFNSDACVGQNYPKCWDQYWAWTRTDAFKSAMKTMVADDHFLEGNFLSTDLRVPVTLLQTNACSPLATNAIRDNIWDDFSSDSYKELPSVGSIKLRDAYTGQVRPGDYALPGGGRGFTRPASLVSVWSTAPYLLNNSVGELDPQYKDAIYNPAPSVEARMRAFQDGIEKMLWPEKRETDPVFKKAEPGVGSIYRTSSTSFIRIPLGFIPDRFRGLIDFNSRLFPFLFKEDRIEIGPIPKGTPVGLIANLDMLGDATDRGERAKRQADVVELVLKAKRDLRQLPANATDAQAQAAFMNLYPDMLRLSKCPDFVANKGHYFGTEFLNDPAAFPENVREPGLSDADKRALIEFLKTF
jgi:hypothetical protein